VAINQTYYCELSCSLDNIIHTPIMAPTPTTHGTMDYCITKYDHLSNLNSIHTNHTCYY